MFDVRDKPKMVERAYLVGVAQQKETESESTSLLDELEELVTTLEIGIVDRKVVRIREPQARYLLGSGKVESIIEAARAVKADCLVLDAELTPAQQRNWEAASGISIFSACAREPGKPFCRWSWPGRNTLFRGSRMRGHT
jgi:GTP-binding protein HflX